MYERIDDYGEFTMTSTVQYAASLAFATGSVGQRYPLTTAEQRTEFGQECANHTLELTKVNTADCGDERITIRLEDGTKDRLALDARIVPQLFGGLGLATTKALVAANSPIVKDAPTVWEAYRTVSELLVSIGEEDGGHAGCGASGSVERSVAQAIELDAIVPVAALLVPDNGMNTDLLRQNDVAKRQRLESGFFGGWNAQEHEDYLKQRFPQNFSYYKVDPNDHETYGHDGSGLLILTNEKTGYQKTGRAFAVSLFKMQQLANLLSGSDEERQRILLGFVADTVDVGAGIVTVDFPVFAQAV